MADGDIGPSEPDSVSTADGSNIGGESPESDPESIRDEATVHDDDTELERTIGLTGGIAIASFGPQSKVTGAKDHRYLRPRVDML